MKDSGIVRLGLMPKEWSASRVKYIYSVIGSGTTPSSGNTLYYDGTENWIQSGDLCKRKYVTNTEKTVTDFAVSTISALHKYKADFIVIAMYGASIGNVAISKIDACVNQACCVIKPNSKVNFNYLYYTLVNDKDIMLDMSIGGTQPNISQAKILELPVFLPPLAEQKKIADFLDEKCGEIDSIRSDVQRETEILNDYKKSVITEAVAKGLNPKAKLKDSGIEWIGKIPEGWNVKRFKYVVDALYKGNGITKEEVFSDGNIECVRYGEIYSKYNGSFSECLSLTKEEIISSPQYFAHGDILLAGTGELVEEIGKNIVYLGNKRCLAGGDIIVAKHSQNPVFLNYALDSSYCQSQKSKGKSKLKVVHISASQIGNILVLLPPLPEQKAIADYLDEKCSEIDATVADKQKQLETLDEYKKSLIFEYVTGKKEVS